MFNVSNGFDVVIGNPPYYVYEGNKAGELDEIKKMDIYKLVKGGKLNAYKLFLARGEISLIKKGMILCYIFQNSFLCDDEAKNIRKHTVNNTTIINIDSFPERDNPIKRVFKDVKMSACIVLLKNIPSIDYFFILRVWSSRIMDNYYSTKYTKKDIFSFDKRGMMIPLMEENEKQGVLKSHTYQPSRSVRCFEGEINMTFDKKYLVQDTSLPLVKKGASIQRYFTTEKMSQGTVEYLDERAYLDSKSRSSRATHHGQRRLVMQGITGANDKIRIIMSLIDNGEYCANSCNYVTEQDFASLHTLLGIFNSKFINWSFRKTSTNSNVNCYEIESFVIPTDNPSLLDLIGNKAKCIDEIKRKNNKACTDDLELEIDEMVYDLYGLTEEEKAIVRESFIGKSKAKKC